VDVFRRHSLAGIRIGDETNSCFIWAVYPVIGKMGMEEWLLSP